MSTDDGGAPSEEEVVRTVIEGPYRSLAAPAARLFRLLGLHPGPDFGLHSAAAVADLTTGWARQLLDDLVGANLLEQTAPDRYQLHDLLRAYATDRAQAEETTEEREAALRCLLTWYLHTADAAQAWISPGEDHLRLPPATGLVAPLAFADYDAAADWTERELPTHLCVVAAATASGDDRLTWQLAETLWHAWPPSSARAEWTGIGQAGVDAAAREQDPAAQLRLLTRLGMAYRECARHDEGLECLGRALHLARATGRPFDEARVLNAMGLIHLRRRELDLASGHFDDAGAILGDLGDQRLDGALHANAATADLRAGRLPEAAVALRQALDIHRTSGDRPGLGNALRLRAELHLAAGRQDEALADARQALDIALTLRDHTREAYWLLTLGDVQRAASAYGDALASYQRSATLHRRLGDRSREALAWRGTGLAYAATGRGKEAAGFLRQAAAAHRALGDAWEEAIDLDHLARVHPEGADGHRARVLELIAPFDDPRAEALRGRT